MKDAKFIITGCQFSKTLEDGTKVITTVGKKGVTIRTYPPKAIKEKAPPKETIEEYLVSKGQLNLEI